MSWKDNMFEAMARLVEERTDYKGVKVTGYEEENYRVGGCETCSYTEYEVTIYFSDDESTFNCYTYNGKFADLMEALT